MKNLLLIDLKKSVELVFGRKISSYRDAMELQNLILLSTEKKIALPSIRRIFNQVKYQGNFSKNTTTILEEFIQNNTQKKREPGTQFSADWLLHFLENAPINNINNPFLIQFIRSYYAVQINRGEKMDPLLIKKIAESPIGRRVFFDQFVNLDELFGSYGLGIQYYLSVEKKDEHRAFAICILALKEIILKNKMGVINRFHSLPPFRNDYHPFIQGRMRAIQWYCKAAPIYPNPKETILSDISHHVISSRNYKNYPAYELMLLEMFWKTREVELGNWLSQITFEKWKNSWSLDNAIDIGYYSVLKELMLKFTLNNNKLNKAISKLPSSNSLPPLATKYYKELLSLK